jgi:hypothetical protein
MDFSMIEVIRHWIEVAFELEYQLTSHVVNNKPLNEFEHIPKKKQFFLFK